MEESLVFPALTVHSFFSGRLPASITQKEIKVIVDSLIADLGKFKYILTILGSICIEIMLVVLFLLFQRARKLRRHHDWRCPNQR